MGIKTDSLFTLIEGDNQSECFLVARPDDANVSLEINRFAVSMITVAID